MNIYIHGAHEHEVIYNFETRMSLYKDFKQRKTDFFLKSDLL